MMVCSFVLYRIFLFCKVHFADNVVKFRLYRYPLSYFFGFALFVLIFISSIPVTRFSINLLLTPSLLFVFFIESVVFTSLIMTFHHFVTIQIDRNNTKLENANLKTKSAEAANLLLKQQIHPHFLFNSLSTLKVLYKQDNSLGEEYLVLLADFLRTSISDSHAVSATLKEELAILENYLNLQRMRFGDALQWEIKVNDDVFLQKQIPAFSLQPLAENAIKHNHFSLKQPLIIEVEKVDDFLVVKNSINKKKYSEYSIGTGLTNISERYQLWSGNSLSIENSGSEFIVKFQLNQ